MCCTRVTMLYTVVVCGGKWLLKDTCWWYQSAVNVFQYVSKEKFDTYCVLGFFFNYLCVCNINKPSLFVDLCACVCVCVSQISGVSSHSRLIPTFLQDGRRSQTWPGSTTGTYPQAPLSGRGPPPTRRSPDRWSQRTRVTTQAQPCNTRWAHSAPQSQTWRWVTGKQVGTRIRSRRCEVYRLPFDFEGAVKRCGFNILKPLVWVV